jgi:hypothetical protein
MNVGDKVIFRGTLEARILCIHRNGADIETSTGVQFVNIDLNELKPA